MKTTFRKILESDPCIPGWNKLVANFFGIKIYCADDANIYELSDDQLDTEISMKQILESNGIQHAVRALKTQEYLDCCLFSADVAESILWICEKLLICEKQPLSDMRYRNCIDAIRDFSVGKIGINELENFRRSIRPRSDVSKCIRHAVSFSNVSAYLTAIYAVRAHEAHDSKNPSAEDFKWREIKELFEKHFCKEG